MYHPNDRFLQDDYLTAGVMLRRVFAWWLDVALLAAIFGVVWSSIYTLGVLTFGVGWWLYPYLPLVPFLYHFLFVASPMCATPGQAVCGISVRRNDNLGRPSLFQALIYTLVFYITLCAGIIWMAVALFTERHRTLHDMLSGLVVVRARAIDPAPRDWTTA